MIKHYSWRHLRNAVGWGAACARLALPLYDGDQRDAVVQAIEVSEQFAREDPLTIKAIDTALTAVRDATNEAALSRSIPPAKRAIAIIVHEVVYTAHYTLRAAKRSNDAGIAAVAYAAVRAGVAQYDVDRAQYVAIAKDLGLSVETTPYYAAIAALAANDVVCAIEIAAENR